MAPPGSKGEPCPDCGRRKWRIESGLRFCRHCGHQAEGFVQYDVEDDVLPGQRVEVARKQKDVREREHKHLSGQKGKELYLEALQLVLRHQVFWLVREKGVMPQLETVVRDLWDLRIRGFPEPTEETDDDTLSVFSSQAASTDGESEGESRPRAKTRAQSWNTAAASRWPMPRVIDTLALCYIGCLLLRVPVSIANIHRWANSGNIPYRTVYLALPEEIRARMPAEYTKALKEPGRIGVLDTTLHNAVYDLACSFHLNYNMCNPEDPSPNYVTTLIELSRALALPVECVIVAMHISDLLQLDHHLPVEKSRVLVVDHPEIRLMGLLVVAAKVCFPLAGQTDPSTTTEWLRKVPNLDWKRWIRAYHESTAPAPIFKHEKYKYTTTSDIAQMSAPDLAQYLEYLTSMDFHEDENLVAAFFPKPRVPEPEPPVRELTSEEETLRVRAILRQSEQMAPKANPGATTMGHTSFENVDSLTEDAKALYQTAAKAAGTSLAELTRAVYSVERQLQDFSTMSLTQDKQAGQTLRLHPEKIS